jgi:hypothetical protein
LATAGVGGVATKGGEVGGLAASEGGSAFVVRGGTLANILKQPTDEGGLLQELSVNSAPGKSVEELASYPPVPGYGKISVTTVKQILDLEGTITPKPLLTNPFHAVVSGISPENLVKIMQELFNPAKG